MIVEYVLGGVVTAALLVYLVYALLRPESSEAVLKRRDHDHQWLDSDRDLFRGPHRARRSARPLHGPRVRRRAHVPVARASAGGGVPLSRLGRRTRRASSTGSPTRSPCCCSTPRASCSSTPSSGCRPCCRSIRRTVRGSRRPRLQHGRQLRHQHQLAELRRREHDELSHPDGGAHHAELRLGRDRHRAADRADPRLCARVGEHGRQLLGRPDPLARSTCCCRCRSSPRCSSSGRACRRTSAPMSTRPRSKAPSRP